MCVICVKPKNVEVPWDDIPKMWDYNSHGAGISWQEGNAVHVKKGFLTLESFTEFVKALDERLPLKNTGVIMHFRIKTHGSVSTRNCHPFPVTDDIELLTTTDELVVDMAMAHNGIISAYTPTSPNKHDLSDTMTFIREAVYPIYKCKKTFLNDTKICTMLGHLAGSKLAFMRRNQIKTIGSFQEVDGCYYSNRNHDITYYSSYNSYQGYSKDWDDDFFYRKTVDKDKSGINYYSTDKDILRYIKSVNGIIHNWMTYSTLRDLLELKIDEIYAVAPEGKVSGYFIKYKEKMQPAIDAIDAYASKWGVDVDFEGEYARIIAKELGKETGEDNAF